MLTQLAATAIGGAIGTITRLTPGLHSNLAATILAGLALPLPPENIGIIILAMAITHTFLDNIPSVFLGAPDADHVNSALPGQRLVLEGRGIEAVKLLTAGALLATLIGLAMTPFFIKIFPELLEFAKPYIAFVLTGAMLYGIAREKNANTKFWAVITMTASGTLGLIVLRSSLNEPLLPLLSGLFGTSTLLLNALRDVRIPAQHATDQERVGPIEVWTATGLGTLAGSIIAILPGLGPSQAGTIVGNMKGKAMLVLTGAINTANFVVSLATMHAVGKARNGSLETVLGVVGKLDGDALMRYAAVTLITAGIAAMLTMRIARVFARLVSRVPYRIMSGMVLAFVTMMVGWFSGPIGLLVLVVSTAIGLIPQLTETNRSHAMAVIIVPVVAYYWGL